MNPKTDIVEKLASHIRQQKLNFSQYNVVRMREALRYLSSQKLEIFIKIPVLIHLNQPDFPGFVRTKTQAHGIFHFERSGFYRTAKDRGLLPESDKAPIQDPAVLGLYHIGSLGTFTQSVGSDFDFWVIIDKTRFDDQRYYDLEQKLNRIVKHSREAYDQEVTFFIMDQADIRKNSYASFKGKETLTAPKIFLKEEFYRTFLMIAGKIPYWTLLPLDADEKQYNHFIATISGQDRLRELADDFIDLGHASPPGQREVLQGLLWHICKSRFDPVKALIKATMVFVTEAGRADRPCAVRLLCEEIKAGYAGAGIDDYEVDPYKLLFDRIITFYSENDPRGLNLIKNAIFLRLCGYPLVALPETGSPKKRLLDRYIREWNLNQSQVSKMLSFRNWPESEKLLLEKTIVTRLSDMYQQIKAQTPDPFSDPGLTATDKRNLKILTHKTMERLKTAPDKIPVSSTYLQRQKIHMLVLEKKRFKGWKLSAYAREMAPMDNLFQHPHLLGAMGWVMENQFYRRAETRIKIDVRQRLFESHPAPVDPDKLYLVMQPLKPLSDDAYEADPGWEKLLILLIYDDNQSLVKAEFLAANTWGELSVDAVEINSLENKRNMADNYRKVAQKISEYDTDGLRSFFFQLAAAHDPEVVFQIKQYLGPPKIRPTGPGGKAAKHRPLLDTL